MADVGFDGLVEECPGQPGAGDEVDGVGGVAAELEGRDERCDADLAEASAGQDGIDAVGVGQGERPGCAGGAEGGDGHIGQRGGGGDRQPGLRLSTCQQTTMSRPAGRKARPMLAKPAIGSAKNMIPNRLIAASNAPGGNG